MTIRSHSRGRRALGGVALLSATALVLAACTSSDGDGGGETSSPEAASPTGGATTPLTLELGSLLPQTGSLAFLDAPMEGGVGLAVEEINAADAGITVNYTATDEGDTDTKAFETSIERIRSGGITAMIGAASSGVSKIILDGNIAAGILTVSPSNTSPDFTTWDDQGLYFRTAPSDYLQGEVLGNLLAEDGHQTVGIIYQNDAYGTGLDAQIRETFEGTGGQVVAEASFNVGDTTFDAQVAQITAAKPDAVVVVSFAQFVTIAPLLINAGITGDQLYMVDGNTTDYSASSETPITVSLEGAKGTIPGPALEDDFRDRLNEFWTGKGNSDIATFTYAGESYDAVTLIALAALAAQSTEGADIAAKMQEVSGGSGDGEKCTTFADCAKIITDGGVADYDGYSGEVTFDENGDPQGATIGIFQYGADNTITRIN
jgi:branched-chain amino acid transport system substrate-binding protein